MKKMTIVYRKTDGQIISMCSWIQDFTMFGEDERELMILTCDILVLDNNDDIINNPMNYRVSDNQVIPIGGKQWD